MHVTICVFKNKDRMQSAFCFLFFLGQIFTLWEHMFFWKMFFGGGWGGDSVSWKIFAKILAKFAKLWKP
jgi:hypothetical protein